MDIFKTLISRSMERAQELIQFQSKKQREHVRVTSHVQVTKELQTFTNYPRRIQKQHLNT